MANFSIIVSVDQDMGIARKGEIPWFLPEHFANLHDLTTQTENKNLKNAIIMGRKTWEYFHSQGENFDNRLVIVLSKNKDLSLPQNVLRFESLDDTLFELSDHNDIDQIFVLGGGEIFKEAILHTDLERIYLTNVESSFKSDLFFPKDIPEDFEVASTSDLMESDGLEYSFLILERSVDHSNDQYFDFNTEEE